MYSYTLLALLALYLITAPYLLWCDYMVLMNLKRQRNAVGLSRLAAVLGGYLLIRGYLHDGIVNALHMTILLREWPRELTVTQRIRRHAEDGAGWRHDLCLRIRTELLDGFDPAGIHR